LGSRTFDEWAVAALVTFFAGFIVWIVYSTHDECWGLVQKRNQNIMNNIHDDLEISGFCKAWWKWQTGENVHDAAPIVQKR